MLFFIGKICIFSLIFNKETWIKMFINFLMWFQQQISVRQLKTFPILYGCKSSLLYFYSMLLSISMLNIVATFFVQYRAYSSRVNYTFDDPDNLKWIEFNKSYKLNTIIWIKYVYTYTWVMHCVSVTCIHEMSSYIFVTPRIRICRNVENQTHQLDVTHRWLSLHMLQSPCLDSYKIRHRETFLLTNFAN